MKNAILAIVVLLLGEHIVRSAEPVPEARLNAYVDDIGRASALLEQSKGPQARKILEKYAAEKGKDVRGFEWGHLWTATAPDAASPGQEATEVVPISHPWWLCE